MPTFSGYFQPVCCARIIASGVFHNPFTIAVTITYSAPVLELPDGFIARDTHVRIQGENYSEAEGFEQDHGFIPQ